MGSLQQSKYHKFTFEKLSNIRFFLTKRSSGPCCEQFSSSALQWINYHFHITVKRDFAMLSLSNERTTIQMPLFHCFLSKLAL